MKPRIFLLVFGCLLAVYSAHGQGKAPNVVLIIADDQAWTDFGFMGHPDISTPHLDRLAAEGLLFPRGYVPSSLCRPSLATLATGLYPHQHGITGNDPVSDSREERVTRNAEWIAHFQTIPPVAGMLGEAGYVSHQSGKWWEGPCQCGKFTAGMTHGNPELGGRHGDEGLKIGRETMQPIFDFVDGAGERPFFIWYAPFLPHLPHNPPERLLAKYRSPDRPLEMAKYYAMCTWFDETVGQLLDYIEDQREDTLVLFVSDNGWVQPLEGQEGWGTSYGAPKGKRSPYDGGLRTPIIVNWRGRVAAGRNETPVSSVDIVPTVLAAAGVSEVVRGGGTPQPRTGEVGVGRLPGVNLLDSEAVMGREEIFGALFTHDGVLNDPAAGLQYRWIVRGPWKLIEPYEPNVESARSELYALIEDPGETVNLAERNPDVVRQLREQLDVWWTP